MKTARCWRAKAHCRLPAGERPITIVGDRDRLRQLFLNLVDNAIKYTPEGGTVTLAVRRQNGTALFLVQDTGIGIPPEEIGKIFNRFYGWTKPLTRARRDRVGTFDREVDCGAAPGKYLGHKRSEQGFHVHGNAAFKLRGRLSAQWQAFGKTARPDQEDRDGCLAPDSPLATLRVLEIRS